MQVKNFPTGRGRGGSGDETSKVPDEKLKVNEPWGQMTSPLNRGYLNLHCHICVSDVDTVSVWEFLAS